MRAILFPCLLVAAVAAAQIPDPLGDAYKGGIRYRQNVGQKMATDGHAAMDVAYYSEGGAYDIYARSQSNIRFAWGHKDTSAATADTLFAVEMRVSGEAGNPVAPQPAGVIPGIANYYVGADAFTAVPAYHEVYWKEVNPNTDMHLYHGQTGPKLAFVFKPGSDPTDLLLEFDGQDSINVDYLGMLRLYIRGRWLALKEAIAYQVDANMQLLPVSWVPAYVNNNGQDVVHFTFGTYDPALPLYVLISSPPAPPTPPTPDPRNLGWSTYAGGNQGDEFMAVDTDADGDAYACGYTNDNNFPVGTGLQVFPPFQADFSGSHDAVVMKFSHADKRIQWATYIGGTEAADDFDDQGIDQATDIAVYKGNNSDYNYAFVTGSTGCNDFPDWTEAGTPFSNAVAYSWASSDVSIHAAFIIALQQTTGLLHWGNTLGPGVEGYWTADGMGLDVDEDGRVAWVGRLSQVFPSNTFDFPFATPTGAFTQARGGGYFIRFNTVYQYEWATPFGSQCTTCGAYDVALQRFGEARLAYLTGTCSVDEGSTLYALADTVEQGFSGFYQSAPGGGITDAYLAAFDLNSYANLYCTRWGGTGDESGTAVAVVGKHIWVGGGTTTSSFTQAQLPGTGGIRDTIPGGNVDGFLLDFEWQGGPVLQWGSLHGGPDNDILLAVEAASNCTNNDLCDIYFAGETRSSTGMLFADNAVLYRQEVLGNLGGQYNRDGFLVGLDRNTRSAFWSTYFGGAKTDKIWGVASSPTELYVVGGARSEQGYFPLKEWDQNSTLDWYDDDIFNNTNGSDGWYAFNSQEFRTTYMANQYEAYDGWTHDGFIASFATPINVGVGPVANANNGAVAAYNLGDGRWSISVPWSGTFVVCDMKGALVLDGNLRSPGSVLLDLREQANGIYPLRITDHAGVVHFIKLYR